MDDDDEFTNMLQFCLFGVNFLLSTFVTFYENSMMLNDNISV